MKKNLKYYVEEFIQKNQFIEDGLYNQYINITSLALMLQPYFVKKLEENISFDCVKMALFRAGKNTKIPKKTKLFSPKNLYIKKDINIANITGDIDQYRLNLRSIVKEDDHYLSKILGEIELSVIFDNFYMDAIKGSAEKEADLELRENLVLIGISVPDGTQDTPGIMYNISKQLMFFGVNIVQVMQTKREFVVIVEEKDIQDTIYVLSHI